MKHHLPMGSSLHKDLSPQSKTSLCTMHRRYGDTSAREPIGSRATVKELEPIWNSILSVAGLVVWEACENVGLSLGAEEPQLFILELWVVLNTLNVFARDQQ